MSDLILKLEAWLTKIDRAGGESCDLIVGSPATFAQIETVEGYLGYKLPGDFVTALKLASHLQFSWFLGEEFELPSALSEIFSGSLHWGLDLIEPFNESYQGWVKEVFANPDDTYDRIWHNKFPFQEVGNGDFLAIDLDVASYGRVIYLSHDGSDGHGYVMANNFSELLSNWATLGCVGAEDWQWWAFADSKNAGLDANSENAKKWLELFQ